MSLITELRRTKKLLFGQWGYPQIKDGKYQLEYTETETDYHGRDDSYSSYKEISKEHYDFFIKLIELEELSKTITGTMYNHKGKTLWEIEAELLRRDIPESIKKYYNFSVKDQPKYH